MHLFASVTLRHRTLLPKDVSINTFHLSAPDTSQATLDAIALAIERFYRTPYDVDSDAVGSFISNVVLRASGSIEIYDWADPSPRVPIAFYPMELAANGVTSSLPNEVALCVSWQGDRQSGVNQARRRGRIFLGPLSTNATTTVANEPARPATAFIIAARRASERLVTELSEDEVRLAVWSRVSSQLTPVTNGWVDNDFDTQRRRSTIPTSRSTWTINV